ncbi:MAG: hypothetical protein KDA44_11635 [Planctomycetales bacterium]|nr:hypothetical protein [Planctomycetales bacterium]
MKSAIAPAAIALGLLLLIASLLWNFMFPATKSWTEEKSVRLTELGNQATQTNLKLLKAKERPSMHSGESAAELQDQFDKISAEYKALYDEFHNASESPKTISTALKWTGIGLTLLGGIAVLATRDA